MRKELMNNKPFLECPSFESCSAPKCPLDPEMDTRVSLKGEDKCKAWQTTRMKIANKYPELLPNGGLSKKRFLLRKRWEALPKGEKDRRIEMLAVARDKRQKIKENQAI